MSTHDHFPMFIDAKDKLAVVIGGGSVAERRVISLSKFCFNVVIISDHATEKILSLCDGERIKYVQRAFAPEKVNDYAGYFADAFMVLACTDDRDINRQIGIICKEHDIHVNVCDAQDESTFWFPAIAVSDELVMGLTGNGKSHETVRKAAAELRRIIEERLF